MNTYSKSLRLYKNFNDNLMYDSLQRSKNMFYCCQLYVDNKKKRLFQAGGNFLGWKIF